MKCLILDLQQESLFTLTLFLFRRTIKDTITFIPVVIILLIPLSPIGHVLVFGAIQRVFPDFFPSCFTERRQNLLGECVCTVESTVRDLSCSNIATSSLLCPGHRTL